MKKWQLTLFLAMFVCGCGNEKISSDTDTPQAITDSDNDGFSIESGDCNDTDPTINPNATEVCDDIDQDCDGLLLPDNDNDGQMDGDCQGGNDCDDTDPTIYYGAFEIPNDDIDQNCNGINETDSDNDGYVLQGSDCNDDNPNINPGMPEICDGKDNDCDTHIDEGFDVDNDGYFVCGDAIDCNDNDITINPGSEEVCGDDIDSNCNGDPEDLTTYYFDSDGDGYGSVPELLCGSEEYWNYRGYILNGGDCNENDPRINPSAIEVCDMVDNNCNNEVDESCQ